MTFILLWEYSQLCSVTSLTEINKVLKSVLNIRLQKGNLWIMEEVNLNG